MRIIKEKFLKAAAAAYPTAAAWLKLWRAAVRRSKWKNIVEVRQVYPTADLVTVKSNRAVTVFNVPGNKYRLIVAFHFNTQKVFTLRFLTHAEYDLPNWKNEL